jgi:hypothetical protein
LGTKDAGRRQTKQKHNIDLCQIVNQTDDSGNVNIIYPSILPDNRKIIRNQQTMKIPVKF